jgi:sulfatase modifying factor 1
MTRNQRRFLLLPLVTLCFPLSAHAVVIDMVAVGNAGNAPDTRYNNMAVGAVDHIYQIGKYEITAGQYTEFLNAVAKADPHGIYEPDMLAIGIQRTGSSPNYSYSILPYWIDQPAAYVTFWNAARFANWLHNGQPMGAEGPGTTEDGAYHDVGDQYLFGRNPGAKYFIPTEDEWYKAAYHDKAAGLAASYFDFPTSTNAIPGKDASELTNPGNNANYCVIGQPITSTTVGEFELSASPYGTFDQGGNVLEWTETNFSTSTRVARGGSFFMTDWHSLLASTRWGDIPEVLRLAPGFLAYGFRIAGTVVPEPSTIAMAVAALAALSTRRRKSVPRNRV